MGLDDAADDANELGDAASRAEQSTRRLVRVSLSELLQDLADSKYRKFGSIKQNIHGYFVLFFRNLKRR